MPASNGTRRFRTPEHQVQLIISNRQVLLELVEKGLFLRELYYAITVAVLTLPPFRERREDIIGWVDYHLKGLQENYGRYIKLTRDAQKFLESYAWPGNLPELVALCNRIMVNCPQYYVDAPQIEALLEKRASLHQPEMLLPSQTSLADSKGEMIEQALKRHGGNRESTAAELGISTTTLWRWMKKYRIPKDIGK